MTISDIGLTEQLSVLNEIGRAISGGTTHGWLSLLDLVHKQTSRLMNADNFFISLYDAASDSVEFKFAIEEARRQEVGKGEWATRTRGKALTEYVIKSKAPLLIEKDVDQWLKKHSVKLVGRLPQSWMGAPLIAREKVIGVIALQSYDSVYQYGCKDLDVLTAIASQAATGIDNARLFYFQQALIASVPHPVIAVDKRGRITHMNDAAVNIVGARHDELIGNPVSNYYWGGLEEARRVASYLDSEAARANIEAFVRSVKDERIPVHLSAAPIRGEAGESLGSVAVLEDLRMAALRGKVRRLFSAIEALNSSNELSSILDTLVIEATALFEADAGMLYLFEDNYIVAKSSVGFPDDDLTEFVEKIDEGVLGKAATASSPTLLNILDDPSLPTIPNVRSGMVIPLSVHEIRVGALLLESTKGMLYNTEQALADMLGRQAAVAINRAQLLEQRDHIQSQLIRSSNAIAAGQIASGVSHEVRNGLNNIKLAIVNVREQFEREAAHSKRLLALVKILITAEQETATLATLAERLHRFSQRLEPSKKPSYVNDVVSNVLGLLSGTLVSKRCKVRSDLDTSLSRPSSGLGNPVMADERQLQQVMVNLVLNALDASGPHSTIMVRTAIHRYNNRASEVELLVRDYGSGIASANLRHIFEPFFTTKDSGTGLGLYICNLIVSENHRGRIEVSTKEGKGSTFSIFLALNEKGR